MDASELLRIELLLHPADGGANKVRLDVDMQPHVVALGFDPIDFIRLEKENPPAGFNDQAIQITAGKSLLPHMCFCAVKRALESVAIEWLQKVVHSVHIKRANGVFIVGGHKDNRRRTAETESRQN